MRVMKETEKGRLLEYEGIRFWIQKRWQRADGSLTPAGKRSMATAAEYRRRHAGFDARKVFPVKGETERAVLLGCTVAIPHEGRHIRAQFWVPRSVITDYGFVSRKIREVEEGFPFVGARVILPEGI
ncbi:MAG: hypothetical protein LBF77_03700 [Spirochaetaceae bacterium]|jgi:hypothetical protein|nr:hypothetical protein [Spirochaetaceae bacterium]